MTSPSANPENTGDGAGGDYETLLVSRPADRVVQVTLHRPKALNALNRRLMEELYDLLLSLDADPEVGCILLTGSEKAFAAGADIREMKDLDFPRTLTDDLFRQWDTIAATRTPLVAAVAGYALGGGCELAMMCDVLIAADTAVFGQPEIKLGVIPGIGGSQRLTRAIGKAKAMDLCLTGRTIAAVEADRIGLVSRVVPVAELADAALEVARTIAGMSYPVALTAKESVNRAFESGLSEGVRFERRVFHSLFATHDQSEGMTAFVEKRPPHFRHR